MLSNSTRRKLVSEPTSLSTSTTFNWLPNSWLALACMFYEAKNAKSRFLLSVCSSNCDDVNIDTYLFIAITTKSSSQESQSSSYILCANPVFSLFLKALDHLQIKFPLKLSLSADGKCERGFSRATPPTHTSYCRYCIQAHYPLSHKQHILQRFPFSVQCVRQ